jgi:Fe-S cluster assembly protein SufD
MIDLKAKPHSLVSNWDLLQNLLQTYGPPELHEQRAKAIREFENVGLPSQKDEEFKYLSLRALEEGQFKAAYGAVVDRHEVAQTRVGAIDAVTVAFVNGEYAPELSSAHSLPAGVFVGSLKDALGLMPEKVLEHLTQVASLTGKLGSTNDERFVQLNTAYLSEGAFVYIPKGVAMEHTIHLLYITKADHGPLVTHPRALIVLEERSEAKLLESYVGLQGMYFTNAVTEVWLAKDAILEHTKYQGEGADVAHIAAISVHQETTSTYTSNVANFGGKLVRNDLNVWVNGEHTETWLNGVNVALGSQVMDNHTRIDHAKPNCNSFEVYKSILGGRAIGVFNGKIFVYEDAQKTDAKQTNQALLLSPTATINTKPQLEIFADDVKCTHGATVGQLREDAMFYLRSRGVPKKQAEALLVYAFAAEVLEKISVEDIRLALEQELFERLNETHDLPEESPAER